MNFNPAEKQPRKQLRMSGYDYKTPGYYFVTLCANDRACLFGEILNGEMRLNAAGKMIQGVWHGISERYTGWSVDTLIVMPNHIHVINGILRALVINKSAGFKDYASAGSMFFRVREKLF